MIDAPDQLLRGSWEQPPTGEIAPLGVVLPRRTRHGAPRAVAAQLDVQRFGDLFQLLAKYQDVVDLQFVGRGARAVQRRPEAATLASTPG